MRTVIALCIPRVRQITSTARTEDRLKEKVARILIFIAVPLRKYERGSALMLLPVISRLDSDGPIPVEFLLYESSRVRRAHAETEKPG